MKKTRKLRIAKPGEKRALPPGAQGIGGGMVVHSNQKTIATALAFVLAGHRWPDTIALRCDLTRQAFIALDQHASPLGALSFGDVDAFARQCANAAATFDGNLVALA